MGTSHPPAINAFRAQVDEPVLQALDEHTQSEAATAFLTMRDLAHAELLAEGIPAEELYQLDLRAPTSPRQVTFIFPGAAGEGVAPLTLTLEPPEGP